MMTIYKLEDNIISDYKKSSDTIILKRVPFSDSIFKMDLQWFAAEDEGRTEEPTEQKLRKAREDGKVAKSADLTSALILLFAVITLALTGKYMMGTMKEMIQFYLSRAPEVEGQL